MMSDPSLRFPCRPRPGCWLLLLLAAIGMGCGGSRKALVAGQRVTIDSLNVAVARLQTDRDRLAAALAVREAQLDSLAAAVQRQARTDSMLARRADSLVALRTDSLRHTSVFQLLRAQEMTGRLRGSTQEVIYFAAGSTTPSPAALERLNRLAVRLRRLPAGTRVLVEGHTDDVPFPEPSAQNNRVLSAERAANVMRYLSERSGLPAGRFETAGYGADQPLFPNDQPALRLFNRRVRIALLKP